jgi:hypothetical protein
MALADRRRKSNDGIHPLEYRLQPANVYFPSERLQPAPA